MIDLLVQKEVQDFIVKHENADEKKLILKQKEILGVPTSVIAEQITGRRKAKLKLPLYYSSRNIVYPPGLNLEQSSSQSTGTFKAEILETIVQTNSTIVDLTGGFGVDSFFLSKRFGKLIYIEPNASLLQFAKHNHEVLGANNIQHQNVLAEEFIQKNQEQLDCAYIDPSRRDKASQKVFKLSDCEPNMPALLPILFKQTNCVLIKTSPLLDIQQGIRELAGVEKVWVVSVDNECKELLFLCRLEFQGEPKVEAVNLSHHKTSFEFTLSEEKNASSEYSDPLTYLYEPNASVLKAGAFKLVGSSFSIAKIDVNTHLYTSDNLVENFPGRIFIILQPVKPDAKTLTEIFPDSKANVITRNYPLTPEELKKKTKLKDGGDLYLIGFSGKKEKHLVAAARLK